MRKPFRIIPLSLFHSRLWPEGRRRTEWEAYQDLIRRSSFHDSRVRLGDDEVIIHPNQVLCSSPSLARDWGWHRSTVLDFLHRLAADGLATLDTRHKATILTLYPDGDAPSENRSLTRPSGARKPESLRPSPGHSTDGAPAHSKNIDSSSNRDSLSEEEFLESAGPCAGPEFIAFLQQCLSGPRRLTYGPDMMARIRAGYLDKLIAEGRLNAAEKDRILLSSNSKKQQG